MKESSSAILFFSSFKGLQIFGLLNWKDGGEEAYHITCLSEWEINDCHNLTFLTIMSSSSSLSYLDWHPLPVFISLSWGGYTFVIICIFSYVTCLKVLLYLIWIQMFDSHVQQNRSIYHLSKEQILLNPSNSRSILFSQVYRPWESKSSGAHG